MLLYGIITPEIIGIIKSYLDLNSFYNSQLVCWYFYWTLNVKEKVKLLEMNKSFMKIIKDRSIGPLFRIDRIIYRLGKIISAFVKDKKNNNYLVNYKSGSLEIRYINGSIVSYKQLPKNVKKIIQYHVNSIYNQYNQFHFVNGKQNIFFKKYDIDYYQYNNWPNYCIDIMEKTMYSVYKLTDDEYNRINKSSLNTSEVYTLTKNRKRYCLISQDQIICNSI